MTTILVVDDSPIDRRLASRLLERAGFTVRAAENGREALSILGESERAQLVVTDLVMPEMDGLTLVQEIRSRYGAIPVVLMTAYGSDEIAVRALQRGAVSYVPKRELATSLAETVRSVLSLLPRDDDPSMPPQSVRSLAMAQWEIKNDLEDIPRVVGQVESRLARSNVFDQGSRIQMSVALREAIVNAILHGNLEIASSLKESDPEAHDALARERRAKPPYSDRKVRVSIVETPDEVTCVVSDDGAGFDLSLVPDPTEAVNLERSHGRGLFLIKTFMTSVSHADGGRTIKMVKRRPS
jgi:CheY-like chemotaxis protein/anti-sigma regulatory factor (Ser/Thr protein kinase)